MTDEEKQEYVRGEMTDRLEKIDPFEYYGHKVSGVVRAGNISSGGPAIPGNAEWYLLIDEEEAGRSMGRDEDASP